MDSSLNTGLPADLDWSSLSWAPYQSSPKFSYRIDYAIAVVEVDPDAGRIDFLVRWEPEAYCHYHRHLGTTYAVVLDGEQHLREERPHETVTKVRTAGFGGLVPEGETHMERAGADGLTMLFSTHAPDGRLFEVIDEDGEVMTTATISEFVDLIAVDAKRRAVGATR